MILDDLMSIGLTQIQAEVYLFLIKHGQQKPNSISQKLKITRTNTYKVLDSLVGVGLVEKSKSGKTLAFNASNPIALASLTANFRAEAVKREEIVNNLMHDLMDTYSSHTIKPEFSSYTGKYQVTEAYRKQINLKEDIKFIHTKSDVAMMGFEVMNALRTSPVRKGNKRHSIMAAKDPSKINFAQHKRSNMKITWIEQSLYTAPVEWSVTKSSLLIASYEREPQAILIIDPLISKSFEQIFDILTMFARKNEAHQRIAKQVPAELFDSVVGKD